MDRAGRKRAIPRSGDRAGEEKMNEQYIMRPGDTFRAQECGCSFTVTSGPRDENMATQAPRCCCGHEMVKQGAGVSAGAATPTR
jgi:hypothetical protein